MEKELLIHMANIANAMQRMAANSDAMLLRQDEFYTHLASLLPPIDNRKKFTRLEAMAYLNISKSTYKRHVVDGTLKPRDLPGGHQYYESDLAEARKISVNKGRL